MVLLVEQIFIIFLEQSVSGDMRKAATLCTYNCKTKQSKSDVPGFKIVFSSLLYNFVITVVTLMSSNYVIYFQHFS